MPVRRGRLSLQPRRDGVGQQACGFQRDDVHLGATLLAPCPAGAPTPDNQELARLDRDLQLSSQVFYPLPGAASVVNFRSLRCGVAQSLDTHESAPISKSESSRPAQNALKSASTR
jgi:hypothetical protein